MKKLDNDTLKEIAAKLRAQGDVAAAYCFGSQTDPECPSPGDVDIAVLGRAPYTLRRLLAMRAEVARAVGSDQLDLVDLRNASPVLKREVVARGKLLFCVDQSYTNDFELRALSEYRDSQHRRRVQFALLEEAVTPR